MSDAKCPSDASARQYEYLKLKYLRKRGVFSRATKCTFFKMFFSTHTLYAHTLYTPFKSLWSKEENDRCQMFIRCFCSIIRVFEAQVLAKLRSFLSRNQMHLVQDVFLHTHTLYAHTPYTPFESLWSKEENDRCQMSIRCFCSILQVLTDRENRKNAEFRSRDQTHFVHDG